MPRSKKKTSYRQLILDNSEDMEYTDYEGEEVMSTLASKEARISAGKEKVAAKRGKENVETVLGLAAAKARVVSNSTCKTTITRDASDRPTPRLLRTTLCKRALSLNNSQFHQLSLHTHTQSGPLPDSFTHFAYIDTAACIHTLLPTNSNWEKMSSDGDDLDEDELLQMALKEQPQRDLNYKKLSQATQKPARNYVQPPPTRGPAARNPDAAGIPQQKKGVSMQTKLSLDENEDSEVELLSISSGDEDDRGGVVPRNRVGSGREDDKWNGEEPTFWKHVDEAELENNVRLLLELEPESDPIKHYFNIQNRKIRGLLEKCSLDYEARVENLQMSFVKKHCLMQNGGKSSYSDVDYSLSDVSSHLPGDLLPAEIFREELDALWGGYIAQLTGVLVHSVPVFWKVALSVSSGKFAKSSQVSAEPTANSSFNKAEDRVGDFDEVSGMIRNTLSTYEAKVLGTFRDLEESNILSPYMNDAIREISIASQAFEAKESAPPVAVSALRSLEFEISKIYIARLCSWMRTSIEEISKDETWVPVSVLERNKSPYSISSLPLAFFAIMISAMDQINTMLQSLQSESAKSEDVSAQLHEMQESVRISFLNCYLDFAGHLEHIGSELIENRSIFGSPRLQNGYAHEPIEKPVYPPPGSIVGHHQQLLMVLSNIGYCKDELAYELYGKYKYVWQSRGKVEDDGDIQELVISFSVLEEKVISRYTVAKAAVSYLLDAGVQWGATPAVKGVRDAAVDLLHPLVAVHAEVIAGCKPLLDKILGILIQGLIDILLGLFNETKDKDLRALDANGLSQLMLELEYFETILNPYFTHDARESLKLLQGVLLDKSIETVTETIETPSHQRRPTRGSDDVLEDRLSTASPDDLIALAQQYSSELPQAELERTRINTACFVETLPLDSIPESAKAGLFSSGFPK
ncbi:Exocyst complex component SEC5A [Striga hermonthica]|uniref:Exocyst complex component SEC5 n=1 Tax=Striga hermonthica TaxID=68872 RepID=A0A9N7MTU8_STRHE|nr:Exocyst complex component SEC5A [Striga hermonthica]